MELDNETQKNIQDLNILEHNLQALMSQKQAFQLELNETTNALEEVKKTKDEVYKVTGTIMLKADKESVMKELEDKKKVLELRSSTIEKQEKLLSSKAEELKEQTKKAIEKQNKA